MRPKSKLSIVNRFGNNALSLMSPNHVDMIRGLAITKDEAEVTQQVERNCAANLGMTVDERKPFMFSDGMAIIPVYGILLHRDNYCDSWATGYDYIRNRFEMAQADPEVKGILFDVHSPGGQVNGNFELCDMIYNGRAKKPSLALVDAMAYSGGYSIGSSASRMIATSSSGVGSIGVVMMHVSLEKALENFGVEVNFIYAGKHKVDGNMFKNLSDDAKTRFQASVDKSYEKFVSLVARNRGMDPDAVKATEALCYDADDGLAVGLIDGISTSQEALMAFRNELNGSAKTSPAKGVKKMSQENEEGKTIGDVDSAAELSKKAKADERARMSAITSCDEAKGRSKLANHLAYNTDLSVEEAKGMLKNAAEEKPEADATATATTTATTTAATTDHFAKAMDATGNPNVGAGDNGDKPKELSIGERIAASHQKVTGFNVQKK